MNAHAQKNLDLSHLVARVALRIGGADTCNGGDAAGIQGACADLDKMAAVLKHLSIACTQQRRALVARAMGSAAQDVPGGHYRAFSNTAAARLVKVTDHLNQAEAAAESSTSHGCAPRCTHFRADNTLYFPDAMLPNMNAYMDAWCTEQGIVMEYDAGRPVTSDPARADEYQAGLERALSHFARACVLE